MPVADCKKLSLSVRAKRFGAPSMLGPPGARIHQPGKFRYERSLFATQDVSNVLGGRFACEAGWTERDFSLQNKD
jgi:hypothetical protein